MTQNRAQRRAAARGKTPTPLGDQNLDTVIVMRPALEAAVELLDGMAELLTGLGGDDPAPDDKKLLDDFQKSTSMVTAVLRMSLIQ